MTVINQPPTGSNIRGTGIDIQAVYCKFCTETMKNNKWICKGKSVVN
jgi:hypothetical protein